MIWINENIGFLGTGNMWSYDLGDGFFAVNCKLPRRLLKDKEQRNDLDQ